MAIIAKVGNTKVAVGIVFLFFLTLVSYSSASVHILAVGDYPHGILKPIYGASQVQVGWVSSLGRIVTYDELVKYDAVFLDSSILPYVKEEPWEDWFTAYAKDGGTLIRVTRGAGASDKNLILSETKLGDGRVLDVEGYQAQYQSSQWVEAKDFWLGIFTASISPSRAILLRTLPFLLIFLTILFILCLLSIHTRNHPANGVAGTDEASQQTNLSLIHISEPTRLGMNSYAVFCWKKKTATVPQPIIPIFRASKPETFLIT